MTQVTLGRTGLTSCRLGFGALPIQRADMDTAKQILHSAYENGVNFFDTARAYSDSEAKLSAALGDVRDHIVIATKTMATDRAGFERDLATSLATLGTDVIDIYQFHNPAFVPGDEGHDDIYEAALEARQKGRIRFIGLTNHSRAVATRAVESGRFDTLQFPFSCLSDADDEALVRLCEASNVGFIAMKAMAGGLIRHISANVAYLHRFANVLPIWGIQHQRELDEFIALEKAPPPWGDAAKAAVEAERAELGGQFCRGCGYCKPCPAGIPLDIACRMEPLLKRAVPAMWTTPEWQEKMARVPNCTLCKACASRCPYHLVPYELMQSGWAYFQEVVHQLYP